LTGTKPGETDAIPDGLDDDFISVPSTR